ncbi:30S ribosomal protein S2 [Candidatus Peregrinibacteria bacterium CG11_big_fil_rev_8_21_14_0_20_46_8]|nr:MAG: 30S ribosomal protein S2 [Candidatus Peregrinibacteria bacterium CG11_big_fil_rev_8_21_14_0_20_46_8]
MPAVEKKPLTEMIKAACHFGHAVQKWNPKMRRYLYTKQDGIHIFDLTKTQKALDKAVKFLEEQAAEGKSILLVSTKLQAERLVLDAADKTGFPYITRKWIPGFLTNFETVKKRIKYFKELQQERETGVWEKKYKKKERLMLARTLTKLQEAFGGVADLDKVPDVVLVFDAVRDELALKEAKKLGLPSVAICDSNADPDLVTYPIPGNDDAIKSLTYFIEKLTAALMKGKDMKKAA